MNDGNPLSGWLVGDILFAACLLRNPMVSMLTHWAERPPRLFDALGTARGAVVERYAYSSPRP